jgi:hypothetical protein
MNNLIITEMNKIVNNEINAKVEAINSGLITALKVELKQELTGVLPDNRIEDIIFSNDIQKIRYKITRHFSFELASEKGVHDSSIFELVEAVDTFNHVMKLTDSVADKVRLTNELIK